MMIVLSWIKVGGLLVVLLLGAGVYVDLERPAVCGEEPGQGPGGIALGICTRIAVGLLIDWLLESDQGKHYPQMQPTMRPE